MKSLILCCVNCRHSQFPGISERSASAWRDIERYKRPEYASVDEQWSLADELGRLGLREHEIGDICARNLAAMDAIQIGDRTILPYAATDR